LAPPLPLKKKGLARMTTAAFGNDPRKIERYRAFWNRGAAKRPLVGFTLVGWFPLGEFPGVTRSWGRAAYLTPEMIEPAAFIDDFLRILREGETLDDDILRGASPGQTALVWLANALGCKVRILPENIMAEERRLSWDEALKVRLDRDNPWFRKYLEFADLLVATAAGRFPIGHAAEIGPTDLHAVLRSHTDAIMDLVDEPEKAAELLAKLGDIFREFTEALWSRVPRFHGGCFDAQYSLWSPGDIVRLQEDAIAAYSPDLYRKFVQPVDRKLAGHFASSFMHLHSTSLAFLDAVLEIDEIKCVEMNNDAIGGPTVADLAPHLRKIQDAGKPLLVRGSFTPEEMRLLMDTLEPRGLMFDILVKSLKETEALRPLLGM
jgi:hypothetical protein